MREMRGNKEFQMRHSSYFVQRIITFTEKRATNIQHMAAGYLDRTPITKQPLNVSIKHHEKDMKTCNIHQYNDIVKQLSRLVLRVRTYINESTDCNTPRPLHPRAIYSNHHAIAGKGSSCSRTYGLFLECISYKPIKQV